MVVFIVVASGIWTLLRTNGMSGDGRQYLDWRWSETKEEMLLAQDSNDAVLSLSAIVAADTIAEWPGFRGTNRDGTLKGIKINTDWTASPPEEIWRKPVGPGCSSFAVKGDRLYTQEQLGENETVSCYSLTTGKAIWKHGDKARFEESHAGPGPRSTPTLAGDHVYSLGATGILNVLDAGTGSVIWSCDASADAGIKVPGWGFASSPLVTGNNVIVALAGKMTAYDITTGNPVWFGTDGGSGYNSPQLFNLNEEEQVVFMSKHGSLSIEPGSGERLWESSDYKVNFNDFIIHKGYAYAFDGPYLTCLDLKDGKRMWRGDRYRGFMILLADQVINSGFRCSIVSGRK